ncbi:FeoB-associated Cys-rich membrane protein [uncultured Ruminococcus sp.]|nr:FeoB-associated Cys-rich membrane protein [uncultured Ruminococcus sp.]
MTWADGIILLLLTVAVGIAVRHIFRHRSKPCSGCCGDCQNCGKKET